jgi:uncharacterized iron-regulated membrane protein
VGLTLTLFLVCVGLTGALLAFYEPLDAWLYPPLHLLDDPSAGGPALDPLELRAQLAKQLPPGASVRHVPLASEAGRPVRFSVEAASGDDEYAVHPVTGQVLASRKWGDLRQGLAKNAMPFIYRLHFSMALGAAGEWVLGLVALLWTVDCFVGAALTFPPRRTDTTRWTWWRRWWPSWRLRRGKAFTFVFTSHRAAGLWLWAALFVFAWSGVAFNLRAVYEPAMRLTLGLEARADRQLEKRNPHGQVMEWRTALARGASLMAAEANARDFTVLAPSQLEYLEEKSAFLYRVRSDRDVTARHGATMVAFDAATGERLAFSAPTGDVGGNTVTTWLTQLHVGDVRGGGVLLRVGVAVTGIAAGLLALSGAWLWWRRRREGARRSNRLVVASGATGPTGSAAAPSPSPR